MTTSPPATQAARRWFMRPATLAAAVIIVALGTGLGACGRDSATSRDEADKASGPGTGKVTFWTGPPTAPGYIGTSVGVASDGTDTAWGPLLEDAEERLLDARVARGAITEQQRAHMPEALYG